jgi:hypothetical protein
LAQDCFVRDFDRIGLDAVDGAPVADKQTLVDQVTDERQRCFRQCVQALHPAPRFSFCVVQLYKPWNKGGAGQSLEFDPLIRYSSVTPRERKSRFDRARDRALQSTKVVNIFRKRQCSSAAVAQPKPLQRESEQRQGVPGFQIPKKPFR